MQGAHTDNYSVEELMFAALNHDLGKVGDLENDTYVPNESEWHVKNQGKFYVNNPDLQFMTPPDRGIWILNQFGINITRELLKIYVITYLMVTKIHLCHPYHLYL